MEHDFTASVWREGEWYVAQCREIDVASQGETESEALKNLGEALHLYLTPPVATILPKVMRLVVHVDAAKARLIYGRVDNVL